MSLLCTAWASLDTGEVPHPVQTCSFLFMHKVSTQRCPSYVDDLVSFSASDPQRRSQRAQSSDVHTLNWTTGVCSQWPGSLEQSATVITHHDFSLCIWLRTHFYKLAFLSRLYELWLPIMWYQNVGSMFYSFVTKHACDRQRDGQNYDPKTALA